MKKLLTFLVILLSASSYAKTFYGHCVTANLTSSCHKVSYHWPVLGGHIGQDQRGKANGIHAKQCRSEWINILEQVDVEVSPIDVKSAMFTSLIQCEKSRIKVSLQ